MQRTKRAAAWTGRHRSEKRGASEQANGYRRLRHKLPTSIAGHPLCAFAEFAQPHANVVPTIEASPHSQAAISHLKDVVNGHGSVEESVGYPCHRLIRRHIEAVRQRKERLWTVLRVERLEIQSSPAHGHAKPRGFGRKVPVHGVDGVDRAHLTCHREQPQICLAKTGERGTQGLHTRERVGTERAQNSIWAQAGGVTCGGSGGLSVSRARGTKASESRGAGCVSPGMNTREVPTSGGVSSDGLVASWQVSAALVGEQASGWTYICACGIRMDGRP